MKSKCILTILLCTVMMASFMPSAFARYPCANCLAGLKAAEENCPKLNPNDPEGLADCLRGAGRRYDECMLYCGGD